MSKFNVGDKVRGTKSGYGYTNEKMTLGVVEWVSSGSAIGVKILEHEEYDGDTVFTVTDNYFEPVSEQPRREFIVIHRSGNVMTAEHRVNREVIKSAKATCAPSDTFDFNTGAKLAFDRLMGREEPKPAPQPAHRFKVGDRVITPFGHGKICVVDDSSEEMPYLIKYDDGYNFWRKSSKAILEPAPAPEPPKFYTGKVVMVDCELPDRKHLINHLFEFKDGRQVGNKMHGMSFNHAPYTSFEQIVSTHNASTWIEVKK